MRSVFERQTGGPEVANSHAPQARGSGYGVANPMFKRCATRARVTAPVQMDLFEEVGGSSAAAPQAQAKRASGAARSAA